MAQKDVDDLIRDIKATGKYDVRSDGAHHKVIDGAGNNIYTMGKTPSDSHWRENAVHGLIRAGVFEHDPKKNGQKAKARTHLASPEMQELKIAAIKERAARLAAVTAPIRDRLQPLIVLAGGWGTGKGHVTASELGRVAKYWGDRERHPDVFKTEGGAQGSAQSNMRHAGGASEQGSRFWDAFVSAWEQAEDQRRWYFDLVREMKGLSRTQVIVGGVPVPPAGEQKNLRRAGPVTKYIPEYNKHPLEPDETVGHLALQAVLLMAVGSEIASHDQILRVGEQILALEELSKE